MKQSAVFSLAAAALFAAQSSPVLAHKLIARGVVVSVADSGMTVTPGRDWNRLSEKAGENTETWTLDGEQLNDVTFYGGIQSGKPLVKERHKKRDPLPKFTSATLLIEVPELLERTYRTFRDSVSFTVTSTEPITFLGQDGVSFEYEYTDQDELTRKGLARATIIKGRLYMITFDAPRLHYHQLLRKDFEMVADSAVLK